MPPFSGDKVFGSQIFSTQDPEDLPVGGFMMLYENGDVMLFEDNAEMIYE